MGRRLMLLDFRTGPRFKVLLIATGTLLALTFALIWASQRSAAATQGPVAEYSFDQDPGEGNTIEDLTGHGHTATIHGAKWTPHGRYGGAMEFDAEEGDYLSVPDSEELALTEEFTLEAWVRPGSGENFWGPLIDKQIPGEEGLSEYAYFLYASDYVEDRPHGSMPEGAYLHAAEGTPKRVWSHVALTYDGGKIRLFVDGQLVDEGAGAPPPISEGELEIGGATEQGTYLDGRIDEVRIYERVLSQGELDADMETPIGTPKSPPVAEYSFDEESETAVDFSGHKNEGTIEAAEWVPGGRYGGALNFDGEESCVTVPDSETLHPSEEFTLEAWVKPKDSPTADPIIFKAGEGTAKYAAVLGFEAYGRPQGWVDGEELRGPESIGTDVWTHLAFTYDGDTLRLYVDGEVVDEEVVGELDIQSEEAESEEPLYIGCDPPAWGDHFHGRIDEPRIYERALTPGEVAADMETPIQTPKAEPIAAYSFDEGKPGDETAEDITGHGHTATLEGEAEWTRGRYGGALGFQKEGDCASVADSPELRLTEEFTIEAWVRPVGGIYEDPVVVRESGGEDLFGLGIGSSEEGFAEAFIGEGEGSKVAVGGERIRPYEWVHLAATWDGAKIRLYVDGELADTEAASAPGAAEGGLRIGCDTPEGPFGGRIDELRVYGRTLDRAEIAGDMETPLLTPEATPVAEYSFDEDNEETAQDLSGDGHTVAVEGATWTEHGRYGGAYEFDAAEGDVLKIPASEELDFDEEFTLEAWVRPSGADNHHAPLIDKQEGSGLGYFLYEGGTVSDRPVGAVAEWQEQVHADEPLPAHAWSHVALTFTGNRTYLYVDGELVDNGGAEPVVTSEGELEIGGSTDTGEYFDGRIDEVRIYNRGLDAAEVAADMEAPIQTPRQGPIAAWTFEGEGEDKTAEDVTGDQNTATLEGATWTTHGKYNSALEFDGKESCVTVPSGPQFELGEEFTLEAWVRPDAAKEFAPVFLKEDSGSNHGYVLWAGENEGGVPAGEVNDASSPVPDVEATAELTPHVWSHLAFTYDGAHMRLYINGELVDAGESGAPIETDGSLRIGCGFDNGSWDYYEGRIDEPRVYERALSPAEIQTSMGPLPIAETETSIETNDTYAVLSGKVNPQGGEATYWFEYGLTTAYGQYGPYGPFEGEQIVTGNESVEVLEAVPGLEPSTTYHYRLVAYDGGATTVGPDRTLTTPEPEVEPLSSSGQIFGLNYRSVADAAEPTTAKLVAESHATMFRVAIGCPNQTYDEIFEHAAEEGVTILPYIVGVAEHVEETKLGSHHYKCPGKHGNFVPPPEEHEAWRQELEAIVRRYGHGGSFWAEHEFSAALIPDHWEIWNEENTGRFGSTTRRIQPSWYGSLLEEAHEAIKSVDPTARILIGGLLSVPKARPTAEELKRHPHLEDEIDPATFLRMMGHYNAFDEASLHPYAFRGYGKIPHAPSNSKDVEKVTERVWRNIELVRAALNELGSPTNKMPIWITEIGWPVRGGGANPEDKVHWLVSEEIQRDLLNSTFHMMKGESKILPARKFRLASIMYYNIADAVNAEPKGQWDYHCGLIEDSVAPEKGKKRKAWFAFQAQAE